MKRIIRGIRKLYFSLPIQLVVTQIRYHKLLIFPWVFLFLTVTNNFGESFGVPYLFLRPEYLGEFGFGSMFILGAGMGAFIAAYEIVTYINTSYQFPFLAIEHRPFGVFFMNNLLIPILFLVVYAVRFIRLQIFLEGGFDWNFLFLLSGFFLGGMVIMLLIFAYFSRTNKNIVQMLGEKVVTELKSRRVILAKARSGMQTRHRVGHYFTGFFRPTRVDHTSPGDFRLLVRILNQNHGNALFLELIFLVTIMGVGLLEEWPQAQIPSGSSILLLMAIFLMFAAAFTFWLRRIGPVILVLLVVLYFVFDNMKIIPHKHPALGMNYIVEPVEYTPENIYKSQTKEFYEGDREETLKILRRWKSDFELYNGYKKKPRAVFISVSGGGLRSAYFTFRVIQKLDSLSDGKLLDNTRLMCGASGGMIGAAYYRELYLLQKLQQIEDIYDARYGKKLSQDLLNRVSFKIVSGIFLPSLKEKVGSMKYHSDRGYSFDDQLMTNLPEFRGRRMGDYTNLEAFAVIPMMMFTPIIVNDGRTLYISSTHMSYMTRNLNTKGELEPGFTGVEFRRFFKKQWADSLQFATALRMNASFPFITPYIQMPSNPPMQIIDAGVADNYGIQTSVKFLYVFREWLRENTDGVLLLQIRDSRKPTYDVPEYKRKTLLQEFLDPISATYSSFSNSKDLVNDDYLNFADSWLGGKFKYLEVEYEPPDTAGIRAALSWHLTDKEKEGLEGALNLEKNQSTFDEVVRYLNYSEKVTDNP